MATPLIYSASNIISEMTRFRYPDNRNLGEYNVIDDFCYISVSLTLRDFYHIASNCVIAGGRSEHFTGGSFGGLSAGCKVFCASDDFVNDIGNVLPANCGVEKTHTIRGGFFSEDFVTIGAGSVVMPNQHIPEGVCIGAMSFVPSEFEFEPWHIYVMRPSKYGHMKLTKLKRRNRENVLNQANQVLENLKFDKRYKV